MEKSPSSAISQRGGDWRAGSDTVIVRWRKGLDHPLDAERSVSAWSLTRTSSLGEKGTPQQSCNAD